MASSVDKEKGFSDDVETRAEKATVRGKMRSTFYFQYFKVRLVTLTLFHIVDIVGKQLRPSGLMVSRLVFRLSGLRSSPDRGDCVLGQNTLLLQCLSPPAVVYKWLPANLMLGDNSG